MKTINWKIIRPLEIEWECPKCKKINKEFSYNGTNIVPGRKRLQCDYCGEEFKRYHLGER